MTKLAFAGASTRSSAIVATGATLSGALPEKWRPFAGPEMGTELSKAGCVMADGGQTIRGVSQILNRQIRSAIPKGTVKQAEEKPDLRPCMTLHDVAGAATDPGEARLEREECTKSVPRSDKHTFLSSRDLDLQVSDMSCGLPFWICALRQSVHLRPRRSGRRSTRSTSPATKDIKRQTTTEDKIR